jgi:hypothetical protein
VSVNAFTRSELGASNWLYRHVPRGSLIVLPVDNFPTLQTADYNSYDLQVMPSDPQLGEAWLDESDLGEVEQWIAGFGRHPAYVVVSRSMRASAAYYGTPRGYRQLVSGLSTVNGASAAYHDADTTIYRLGFG